MALPLPTLEEILSEISTIHNAQFQVVAGPFNGGSNSVYAIQSPGGRRWSLRIPRYADRASWIAQGTGLLKVLKETRPALLAPAVIQRSEYYTVMEYLDGEPLGSWNTVSLARERRQALLDDLAGFLFLLWTTQVQAPQDAECTMTYRDWLRGEVDRGLRRALGTTSWGDPVSYLYRRVKIDDLVPGLDDATIAIKHGDLNAWNMIVTEEGLSGIVDWDTSRLLPAPTAIQHPLFIADIPGWLNDGVPEGMTFEEDRAYLESAVGELDAASPVPGRLAHLLRTSFERQFMEMSLHNRRVNAEYNQRRFEGAQFDRGVARAQLEDFLSASGHESMRDLPAVADVRRRLAEGSR